MWCDNVFRISLTSSRSLVNPSLTLASVSMEVSMATGKVDRVFPDRSFGFIKADGGGPDVHFSTRDLPTGKSTIGAKVEFEVGQNSKGLHAKEPKLIEDGAQPATPPAQAIPSEEAPKKAESKLVVSWRFAAPEMIGDNSVRVQAWIGFKRDGQPALGTKAELFRVDQEGQTTQILSPAKKATADKNGEVYFAIFLDPETTCELRARVNREYYTCDLPLHIGKPLPAPALPPAKAVSVEVTVFSFTASKKNPVRLVTKDASDNRCCGEVTIVTGQRSALLHGDTRVEFSDRAIINTDERDHDPYLIQLLERDGHVNFICGETAVTHMLLKEA